MLAAEQYTPLVRTSDPPGPVPQLQMAEIIGSPALVIAPTVHGITATTLAGVLPASGSAYIPAVPEVVGGVNAPICGWPGQTFLYLAVPVMAPGTSRLSVLLLWTSPAILRVAPPVAV